MPDIRGRVFGMARSDACASDGASILGHLDRELDTSCGRQPAQGSHLCFMSCEGRVVQKH